MFEENVADLIFKEAEAGTSESFMAALESDQSSIADILAFLQARWTELAPAVLRIP